MRFAILILCACHRQLALQGAPAAVPAERLDGHGIALALPVPGAVRADALADGWPVWVVHHFDGRVDVLSAVSPPRTVSAATVFAGPVALVRWVPASRRFLAGDIAYDEDGHVLGYASGDGCGLDCPKIVEPPDDERDLDRFEIARSDAPAIAVWAFRPATPPAAAPVWVDYGLGAHLERAIDLRDREVRPTGRVPIADALARPVGRYALVSGEVVQSTRETPRLCGCGACDRAPAALGVAAVTVDKHAVHYATGTMLVRRVSDGLAVIALTDFGDCLANRHAEVLSDREVRR